jgi:hypothetical protein
MPILAVARKSLPYFAGVSVLHALVGVSAFFVALPNWFLWLSVFPGVISLVVCHSLLVGEWGGWRRSALSWMLRGIPIWARVLWFGTLLASFLAFPAIAASGGSRDAAPTPSAVHSWVIYGLFFAVTATMTAWATLRTGPFLPQEPEETTSPY